MKQIDVIKSAILTEKAHLQMTQNVYSFIVYEKASKKDIERAVNKQFGIEVEKVNVSKIGSKTKKIAQSKKTVQVGGGKKAIVWVKKGQTIAMLAPQTGKKKETDKKEKKDKKEQVINGT